MSFSKVWLSCSAMACLAFVLGTFAVAQEDKEKPSEGQPQFQLPPGWTAEDMQACILAGTPGKMHEHLAKSVGEWQGKTKTWMAPDTEPISSACKVVMTPAMEGRYVKTDWTGDIPGMGPYHGFGIYGYDNVAKKFVSTWIDNHSTGIMKGHGKLSEDGKQLTWQFEYMCPVTEKPTVMREIETVTGPDAKKIEMYATDPKSGKEYKMMEVELSKKPSAAGA